MKKTKKKTKFNLRLTIGTKLIGLIAFLLVGSVTTIVYQSTEMYVSNDKENIRVSNVETTSSLANQTREIFGDLSDKMRFLGMILWQNSAAPSPAADNPVAKSLFERDKDFVGFMVQKLDEHGALVVLSTAFSPEMAGLGDGSGENALAAFASDKSFSVSQLLKGESQISPLKFADGSTGIAVSIPLVQSETTPGTFSHTATAFIRPGKFSKIFSESARGSSFLVNREGLVLAHTDATRVGESFSNLAVVKEFLAGSKTQNMVPYTDPLTNEARIASYRVVGFAGLGVVSEVPEALAYQAATTMEQRSILVGFIILFIAFWAGYMYSGTITRPIQTLVHAAQRIASGDFKINLKAKGKDEIAHLSRAFNEMAQGLEERDRVKETFNKFHNKEIVDKLLSGEVKLGGERKEATIFFSDVRGFTAMSEAMEPEQVVEMLNEYMTRMVVIVRKHHGVVDKYIGDAIMAIWGVPIGRPDDMSNALLACLEMRIELARLNELRISRGQGALKIGMGLNTGPVIAGNIGSIEKMEYTVIGDSVNLASRMESMTKEYGTDLLVPKTISDRLKGRFVFEQCKSAKVKGKAHAIEIFKVKGYIDENKRQVLIETKYSSYEAEKSDKVVHAPEAAEVAAVAPPFAPPGVPPFAPPAAAPMTAPVAAPVKDVSKPVVKLVGAGFYVKMFGETMGPFTEAEIRSGVAAGEFPPDATVAPSLEGVWSPISLFVAPPPPFRKRAA
jgi:adenylate cyclase